MLTIVFLPLIVGFVLMFLPRRLSRVSKLATLIISVITFIMGIVIFISQPADYFRSLVNISGFELQLILAARPLGSFILMFAMGFGLLITLYSLKSMSVGTRLNEYYGAILLTLGGSAGILLCDHLIFLLIFWEIVTVSLYVLIATGGKNSNFAATKSFAMIGFSDGAFLLGIAMVWILSGTFVTSDIMQNPIAAKSPLAIAAFLLLMTAAITKAGAMPLHTWLPDSGEYAPVSVMALLPAALDKLLGIFLLVITVKGVFALQHGVLTVILAIIGSATIIIAVMIAMIQHNLKKLLSYHAVSQVGYMILGIATLTPVGIAGGIFHMLNNAVYKCCLFLCGGAVEKATGTAELDRLGGLGNKMTFTFAACFIAALSISGVPPLNGFVSKWMVYQGVIEMGSANPNYAGPALWPIWLAAAMFGSALTLASFVKIIHSVFLSRLPSDMENVREVSPLQTIPMMVLAVLCILLGVFYYVPLKYLIYPALGIEYGSAVFGNWDSMLATGLLIICGVIAMIVLIVGLLSRKARKVSTWTCGEVFDNDQMIVPGTHFYKSISSMDGLKQLYEGQEKGWFDLYDQTGKLGQILSNLLRWLHGGYLSMYLTWVIIGLLIVLFVLCDIW